MKPTYPAKNKLVHAVVKLVNGEELVCMLRNDIMQNFGSYQNNNRHVTLHKPMKASIEQFYEKSSSHDEDGADHRPEKENIAVYEKTIMSAWIRFAYITDVDISCSHILVMVQPEETTIEKYNDLILKYDTFMTNPELAEDLYGYKSNSDFNNNYLIDEDEDEDDYNI